MAAPSYSTDLTDWIADNDTTAWGELTGAISGGAPDEADTESALQGTNTVSQATNTTSLCSMARILGTPVTLSTGQVFLVWHGHGVATALDSYANGGLRLAVAGNALGNWKAWAVGGNDVPPFPYGKWVNNPIDPTITSEYSNGTPPTGGTDIYGVGSMCLLTQNVAKGQPHVTDIIRYGRAEARINGGDLANGYATFAGFAAQNDSSTNRWGLIQSVAGGYQWKGLLTLGYTSAVDFRDSNTNVFVQDCRKVTSGFNKIEIRQASSRVDWTNISFLNASAASNASKGALEVIDNADVNIDSCSFTDMDTFVFLSGSSVVGTTFRRCGLVTPNGSTFTDNVIARSTASIAVTTSASNLSTIQNCSFISAGTGHGLEITGSAGEYTLVGNQFSGYAGSNGSTGNEAVYVNISTGTVTLNITSGGSTPSIRTAGATVVVNSNVSVTLTGLKNPTEVRVFNAGTQTERSGTGNENVTNGTHTFSVPSGTAIDISILSLGYQNTRILNFSTTADATIPVSQVLDRQYENP